MKYNNLNLIELKNRKNKWQAVCDYKDSDGKRKLKRKTLPTPSKREAWKLAEEWFNDINNQAEQEAVPEEETVAEVISKYLENQRDKHLIEDSTYFKQSKQVKSYIQGSYIGSLGFYSLERTDIERWITELFNKSLSPSTIHHVFSIASKVYADYVKSDRIQKNPFDAVKKPTSRVRKTYLTDAQMTDYLAAAWLEFDDDKNRHYLIACLLLYYCGMRQGEVCALRNRNIDFEKWIINIDSATALREEGQYLKDPKNKSSIRSFPIPEQIRDLLLKRYEETGEDPSSFICSKNGKKPLNLFTFQKRFRRMVLDYNLRDAYGKHITMHGLRHSLGYAGVRSGMDIAALSRIMGHSRQSTTLNVYSDTSPDAVKVGMEKLSSFFKKRDLDE